MTDTDTGFRTRHPVDLLLGNAEGEAAIRIMEPDSHGEDLHLSIENRSNSGFFLQAPEVLTEPRPSNYHVEVRFRPGVLDLDRLREVQLIHTDAAEGVPATWQLSHQHNDDRTVSFFLLHDRDTHVSPGERLHLKLTNITASPTAGSRPTLVEVVVRKTPGQARRYTADDLHRIDRMRLVRRRGIPVLPLEPAWVGSDTILNDGKSLNELRLDLVNCGSHPISFDSRSLDTSSTLILSDVASHDEDPRRVSRAADLARMEVDAATPGWSVRVDDEGPRPIWVIHPLQDVTLHPRESLSLLLTNLVCDATSGTAEFTIDHSNVPGHWDGRRTVTIRKAPLVFRRATLPAVVIDPAGEQGPVAITRDRVGIQTGHPALALSIGHPGTGLQAEPDGGLGLFGADARGRDPSTAPTADLRVLSGGRIAGPVGSQIAGGLRVEAGLRVLPTAGDVDLAVGSVTSGLKAHDREGFALRSNGVDRLAILDGGTVWIPEGPRKASLAIGAITSGINAIDNHGLELRVANQSVISMPNGERMVLGNFNSTDTVQVMGKGVVLALQSPSRWDVEWGLSIDTATGNLQFGRSRSGRSGQTTVLQLGTNDHVVATRTLETTQLKIGQHVLTEDLLRNLYALVGDGLEVEISRPTPPITLPGSTTPISLADTKETATIRAVS